MYFYSCVWDEQLIFIPTMKMDVPRSALITLADLAKTHGCVVLASAHPDGFVDVQFTNSHGHLIYGYQILPSGEIRGPYHASM